MAIATSSQPAQTVALELIDVPDNVRGLDPEHVRGLKASIALQGLLVPIILHPIDGGRFELAAGFHRFAAVRELGWSEIPYILRDPGRAAADKAVENITRKQLNPAEEATAVHAMLEQGLSEDGAAQALGWSRARVTARVKLLELPDRAQQMAGTGTVALSAVDQLRAIGKVSPPLLEAVLDLLEQDPWAAERLAREPGWVLDAALRAGKRKVFAAHLSQLDAYDLADLRLGKKTEALLEEATRLHKQLDRYAYGPRIRFSEQDVDQARAAGVLVEFERSAPVIVDRTLYRQLAKTAITRTVEELRAKAATAAAGKKAAKSSGAAAPADPLETAQRERDRQLRELSEQSHGVNLDLGAALLTGLSTVDPADVSVAKFFTYALLGPDHDGSPYTQQGAQVARLAAQGIRLALEEFRADVTKTRKDGSRGRLRIDYGDHRSPEKPIAWLWRFVDGARSAGELYGRALVVITAEQYASRLVVPQSQRLAALRWGSHKDRAARALKQLAGPHLPASLKELEKAITRAQREYEQAQTSARGRSRASRARTPHTTDADTASAGETSEPELADTGDEELIDGEEADEKLEAPTS